ncbi:MAG: UDP-N-acetylmuramoyl-tripeptide--D-alanyl-D-alanine ligase [Candidatus Paceibacterota bacterium]
MKDLLKAIVAFFLGLFARAVLHKYRPTIVMITGSVGKTSTKDAVGEVLTARFLVRKSDKSFNSEFGVPFTILNVGNPWGNPFAWFSVLKNGLALLFLPNHYPNMLVLETGADKPGDLARILRIATPDAVVVTRLPDIPVHVEAYTSPEAVQEEEFSPAYALRGAAPLIIPSDKPHLREMAERTPARILSYGPTPGAFVHTSDAGFYQNEEGAVEGMTARVTVGGEEGTIIVRGSVGAVQILPIAAALATAQAFDISLTDALRTLESYVPPPGRGRLLRGKHGSTLIDDTYNSSPVAVEEALATLKSFPGAKRRIAVLGDMLELGRYSVQEHERIATLARESVDLVVAVGIRSRVFAHAKGKAPVTLFDDAHIAARELIDLIQPGDVVVIKGSQSIRMERVVEALLADSADSAKLVRQEQQWKKR